MNIPRYYLSLIDENDPNEPIRKLALPDENPRDEEVIQSILIESRFRPVADFLLESAP